LKENSAYFVKTKKPMKPLVPPTSQQTITYRLEKVKVYIDGHFHERISLQDMADVACISLHHFLRQFKKRYNVTPHRYLQRQRLKEACRLLDTSEHSVNSICQLIGYEDVSYFGKLFKSHAKVTPEQYRQKKSH
jgi:AraC family transcriptional regulator